MRPISIISAAVVAASAAFSTLACAQTAPPADQGAAKGAPYLRKELSPTLLKRIRAITDTFQQIDSISYDQAVDVYKRDSDPEGNILLWEEMVKAYKSFCRSRCKTDLERMDVYRVLLLRTMFSEDEVMKQAKPRVLTPAETMATMKYYHLAPKPIDAGPAK